MKLAGIESKGFMIIGMTVLIMGAANIFSIYKVQEVSSVKSARSQKFSELLKLPFKSRGFRRIIFLFVLWNFGFQLGAPFVAVYMVTDLDVSYTMMTVYGIMTSVMRMIFPSVWGRISDRKSWYLTVKGSIGLLALSMVLWYFVDSANVGYMAPVLFLLTGFAWSGIGLSLFNIQYMYAKKEGRTMYIGLNAAVGGVFSLVGVLVGGLAVNAMGMQMSFIMSGIVLAFCPIYVKYFVEQIPSEE
jgi:predicted MFS family arabinose efflux permease